MASFFKKKAGGQVAALGIQMTDSEAALAQSDFNIEKITEIQNKFTGSTDTFQGSIARILCHSCSVTGILLYPGRIFIREGLLWKVCRKGPKKRQFFLFNDILVYGSVVANRYSNQHILPLSQMSVSAECFYQPRVNADFDEDSEQMELNVGNAFQISHANKSFHVFALSNADKANWLANLHKHINRVAQSVSGDSQLVTKPVWVPDAMSKECMICSVKFTAFVRKHHCRRCGRVICSTCSPHRISPELQTRSHMHHASDSKKLERVCKECFKDASFCNNKSGGISVKDIPSSVVAVQKDNVLQPMTVSQSPLVKQNHESSTDTEDSDDSENEPVNEPTVPSKPEVVDDSATMSDRETQPTPPPRKKKLKKKLEVLVEKQLQLNSEACVNEQAVKEDELSKGSINEGKEDEKQLAVDEDKSYSGDLREQTDNMLSSKKRRRKNKHIRVEDLNTASSCEKMGENECEDGKRIEEATVEFADATVNEESVSVDNVEASEETVDCKKVRNRKTKFK